MKRKLFIFSFFFTLVLVTTTAFTALSTYSTKLNGIVYEVASPLIQSNDTIYIALPDLSDMLLGEYIYEDYTHTLILNNQKVELLSFSGKYTINNKDYTLPVAPLVYNKLLYTPVQLLDELGFSYRIDDGTQTLHLTSEVPYSRNADNPEKHTFSETKYNLTNVPLHIPLLSSHESFNEALETALSNASYIGFLDDEAFKEAYEILEYKFQTSPYNNISLTFRDIDTSVYPNRILNTVTLPVTVAMENDLFRLTIDGETFIQEHLWTTFYPVQSLTEANLNKSLDATLMMFFYTYYRDRYDLRDDTYFSPFITLTSERTNTMEHGAYSLTHDNETSDYMIKVHRVHPSGEMRYIIDLVSID